MLATSNAHAYWQLVRGHKPVGSLLLLWPTLWALWLANSGTPPLKLLIIFTVGTFIMRAVGCILNDMTDKQIDKHVRRTRKRPLAAGKLTSSQALRVALALLLVAGILVLLSNRLTVTLALAAVVLCTLYPWCKRCMPIPQAVLGIAFSWSIPMAYAASTGSVPPAGWLLFAIATLWPIIYDTMYAMADKEDDIALGLHSSAILFNGYEPLILGSLQVLWLSAFAAFGYYHGLGLPFALSIFIAILLSLYQQWLIRGAEPQACLRAFYNNSSLGFFIWLGIVISLG